MNLAQKLEIKSDGKLLRIEMAIPLANSKYILVTKHYNPDENIITNDNFDHPTQELAIWPDFICPDQDNNCKPIYEHYFYYTSDVKANGQVDFKPIVKAEVVRSAPRRGQKWYMSKKPLLGFIGSVGNYKGLIFIKHNPPIEMPHKFWKRGVDFGSTHKSVFYREAETERAGGISLILIA